MSKREKENNDISSYFILIHRVDVNFSKDNVPKMKKYVGSYEKQNKKILNESNTTGEKKGINKLEYENQFSLDRKNTNEKIRSIQKQIASFQEKLYLNEFEIEKIKKHSQNKIDLVTSKSNKSVQSKSELIHKKTKEIVSIEEKIKKISFKLDDILNSIDVEKIQATIVSQNAKENDLIIENKLNEKKNNLLNIEKKERDLQNKLEEMEIQIKASEFTFADLNEKNTELKTQVITYNSRIKSIKNTIELAEKKHDKIQNDIKESQKQLADYDHIKNESKYKLDLINKEVDIAEKKLKYKQIKIEKINEMLSRSKSEVFSANGKIDLEKLHQDSVEKDFITEAKEPIESTETKEPIESTETKEPIESAETKKSIESTETKEPIESAETKESIDSTEVTILDDIDAIEKVIDHQSMGFLAFVESKDRLLKVMRKEKKYSISLQKAITLAMKLDKVLLADPHNGSKGYLVRSLYFDTIKDRDYYEKEYGLLIRKKIRLRVYSLNSNTVKLEKKEKIGDDQCKRSLDISKEIAIQMSEGNYNGLLDIDHPFAEEIYMDLIAGAYIPKCIVEYNRKAYIVDENDTRITIDSNIRASESDFDLFSRNLNCYPVSHLDDVTLEVKYNHFLLSFVKDMLNTCLTTQVSKGKYYMGRGVGHGNMNIYR